ncbi:MAG: METTL5 family protein [Sulfolobales archaeon]|nr:METTL5 family protein [Sulfolobales archaeon]MDW8082508.1 METTL5 family protein [Sulfolobales archaeon]
MRIRLLRDLEIVLEQLHDFSNSVERLEQYRTPGDVAATLLWDAYLRGDLDRPLIVDLGCGTGVLTFGSLLLKGNSAVCLDIDWRALEVARDNLREFRGAYDLVAAEVENLPLRPLGDRCVVVMNPPFGVKNRGADLRFLRRALSVCSTVYSIHKYSPESLKIISELASEMGFTLAVVAETTMTLKQRLRHHRKRVHRFEVFLIRLTKTTS